MDKVGIEQQGLLQPEAFDIDDGDSAEQQHISPARDRSRAARRWTRPRFIIIGLTTLAALLIIGTAINKGAGIKLPKLGKVPPFSPPTDNKNNLQSPEPDTSSPGLPADLAEKPASSIHPLVSSSAFSSASMPAPTPSSNMPSTANTNASFGWEKPTDFKIIGLIFFGRPPVVAILDCYLKKNLVSNGGWLDEVQFVVNTDRIDDIKYLDKLVEAEDLYKRVDIEAHGSQQAGYQRIWKTVEKQHMYIKIDDDIVSTCILCCLNFQC